MTGRSTVSIFSFIFTFSYSFPASHCRWFAAHPLAVTDSVVAPEFTG